MTLTGFSTLPARAKRRRQKTIVCATIGPPRFNPKSYRKEQKRLTAEIISLPEPSRRSYFHGFTPLLEPNPEWPSACLLIPKPVAFSELAVLIAANLRTFETIAA